MPGEVENDLQNDSNHIDAHDGGAAPTESSTQGDPSGAENNTPPEADGKTRAEGSEGKEPSADAPKKGREGRLESVMKILGLKKDGKDHGTQDDKAGQEGDKKPDAKDAGTEAGADKPGKEAGKDALPPEIANHPAFKKLQNDLNASSALAKQQTDILKFVEDNHIAPQNVSAGFRLMALAANAPEDFYKEICKIQQDYAVFLGHTLPADLHEAVEAGEISEERAKQVSKDRIEKQTLQERAKLSEGRMARTNEETERAQNASTVNRWFDEKVKKDPSLLAKADAIQGEILRLKTVQGEPKNQNESLALLDKAYENVTKRMVVPRQPTRPAPRTSGNAPAHRPTGNTTHDKMVNKVQQVLNRRQAN